MSSSHPTANAQQQLESEIASIRFCGGDEVSDDETARTESSEVHAVSLCTNFLNLCSMVV